MSKTPLEIVENSSTSSEELWKLSETQNNLILSAIARHPNASPELLQKLFKRYPCDVINNPVLELILLEIPNFLDLLCQENYVFFANSELPNCVLNLMENKVNSNKLRCAIAENQNTCQSLLTKLSIDEEISVRSLVAQNINTPIVCLERLSNDKSPNVRMFVAKNINIPVLFLEKLAMDEYEYIRAEAASNPKLPLSYFKKFTLDSSPIIRRGVALNPNTPLSCLEVLAEDLDPTVRERVTLNPNIPQNLKKQIEDKGFCYPFGILF